jgi:hypothetical protein
MRSLSTTELNNVAGAALVTEYYFPLLPGVEVIGFEQILVGYDTVSWVEHGFFQDTVYKIESPIYEYSPIYAQTYTTISF